MFTKRVRETENGKERQQENNRNNKTDGETTERQS